MQKNAIILLLGLAVVVLLVLVLRTNPSEKPPAYTDDDVGKLVVGADGATNVVVKTETKTGDGTKTEYGLAPLVRSVERRPLEPEATKRLHDGPVVVTALFEAAGRAEHGSYGKTIRGSYVYATTVKARSEILSKTADAETGGIRVVEKRTFLQARDQLGLSDLDAAIDLETLPVGQVKSFADGAVDVIGGIALVLTQGAAAPLVAEAKAAVEAGVAALHARDGAAARGLLGAFGVEIPGDLDAFVRRRLERIAGRELENVKVALQSIEGKTFLVTYAQAADGMPLNVDFVREGGGPISDAEWEILRSANAFLDANAVPDARCRPGDSWTIWADEAQELFGAAGAGRAEGEIRVTRAEDRPDGAWTLRIEPSEISFKSEDGTTAGLLRVKDGNGIVDAENASVESLQATAGGNLRFLDRKRHAMFFDFVKKMNGDANLRFVLSVDPAE